MTAEATHTNAIEKTLELEASVPKVWAALTDPSQLGAWFPDRVEDLPRHRATALRLDGAGQRDDPDKQEEDGSDSGSRGRLHGFPPSSPYWLAINDTR